MKLLTLFGRPRARRTPASIRVTAEFDLPTRDWADLPTYHPGKV